MNNRISRFLILLLANLISISLVYAELPNITDDMYGTEWYGIYMGRNKIGYSKSTFEKIGKNKWSSTITMTLTFKVNQAAASVSETDKRTYEGKNGEMTEIEFHAANPTGGISVIGEVQADSFRIATTISGQTSVKEIPKPAETLEDIMMLSFWAQGDSLVSGDTLEYSTFLADPPITDKFEHLAIVKNRETILFAGVPTLVYTVYDSTLGMNIGGEIIITDEGRVIEQRAAGMAIITRAEPEEIAKQINLEFDLLSNNVIACDSGPADAGSIKKATYLISGFNISSIPAADNITIEQIGADSVNLTIVSDSIAIESAEIPESLNAFLQPEQLIQSDNSEIITLAKEIVKGAHNRAEKAKSINHWVYSNINKEYSPEISNALATLRSRKGDCGEHSALAVALLRASGIPARIASGVVYWPEGKGFAYHAWVELYLGRWIQMDPTWDESIANATHIMLTNEGAEKQIAVIASAIRGMKIKFKSFE